MGAVTRFLALVLALLPLRLNAVECMPVEGIQPICGLHAPEDIELLPGGRFLVFSQMAPGMGLSLLDTADDTVRPLYPPGANEPGSGWGDQSCTAPQRDELLLHGIHVKRRGDGRVQVLAVNHGGRESVEFFEVLEPLSNLPVAVWRGCVEAPGNQYFNDVAGLSDGGFLVTNMFPRDAQLWSAIKALFGAETGNVLRWRPAGGFEDVPGTFARVPNGIAVTPEEDHFFLNVYIGGELRKYALAGGEPVASVPLSRPDNSAWDSSGRLLVASHDDGFTSILDAIPGDDGSPVDLRFRIVAVDPDTLELDTLLERSGPPMGGGTVAVEAAGHLYIGSYAGDRIIKFPMTLAP
jgi:hypothetical protein